MKSLIKEKPWGNYEQFILNQKCTVKILNVNPNEELSLQFHNHRDEFWKIIAGDPVIIIEDEKTFCQGNEEFFIKQKSIHKIIGGKEKARILEISLGEFDELDIVRLEDKYKR